MSKSRNVHHPNIPIRVASAGAWSSSILIVFNFNYKFFYHTEATYLNKIVTIFALLSSSKEKICQM